jgi:hypothetical protein
MTIAALQKFLQYVIVEVTPSSFSFISSLSWNSFNRSHFSILIHEYIVFPPHSPPVPFLISSPPTGNNPQKGTALPSWRTNNLDF